MEKQMVSALFDYHYALFERIWDIVDGLTAEQFVAETDYSLGSLRNHLVHCMNVDVRWAARLRGQEPPAWQDEHNFRDQATARAAWQRARERVLADISEFSEDELNETIPIVMPHRFAEPKRNTRRDILLHMVNHGTDHRAQILARLHDLGAPTLEQDLILHQWAQGEA